MCNSKISVQPAVGVEVVLYTQWLILKCSSISLSEEMTAVSVCGKVSGYRKGYSSLPEANVRIVLPNRGSHTMSYCRE